MKTAIKSAQSYELTCPHCKETIPQPDSGSLFWTVGEIHTGKIVSCPSCDRKVRLPKA